MTAILIGALAYILASFPIAYFWHLTVFKDRYESLQVYRKQVVPLLGLLSMVIQGVAFAFIYVGLIQPMTGGWLFKGLCYAAFGGLLSWSFTTIAAAAKSPMTSIREFIAIETAFTALQWIVVGLITALVVQ